MGMGEETPGALARLLPLFTFADSRHASDVAQALEEHGLTQIEVALRSKHAETAIRAIRAHSSLRVVAGTLLSIDQLDTARDAGAHAGVAPHLDPEVLAHAQRVGFDFAPGIATPSEAHHAIRAGSTTVKVFPIASLGGPSYLKSLTAVYPNLSFIPSGGIGVAHIGDYLGLDFVSMVSGSWLSPPEAGKPVGEAFTAAVAGLVGAVEQA